MEYLKHSRRSTLMNGTYSFWLMCDVWSRTRFSSSVYVSWPPVTFRCALLPLCSLGLTAPADMQHYWLSKCMCPSATLNGEEFLNTNVPSTTQCIPHTLLNIKIHYFFNVHGTMHHINILLLTIPTRCTIHRVYFYLTTALHVSGVTITHRQEHKTVSDRNINSVNCVASWNYKQQNT
jgi:hypothetical protein